MNILQKICFVLLLTTFSSVYGWDCFKDKNIDNCSVKAEQGNAESQYHLGVMYQRGDGVFRDYNEAVKWYRKSAEQGHSDAQYNLGIMYERGHGVPQDYKEAVKWYKKSAEQGESLAQYNLGVVYGNGEGVPQGYIMANMYSNIDSVNGDKDSVRNRDEGAKKTTSSQIERVENLVMEWMERAEDLVMEWERIQGKLEDHEDRKKITLIIIVVTIIFLFYFFKWLSSIYCFIRARSDNGNNWECCSSRFSVYG